MRTTTDNDSPRRISRLEWFINSVCDYSCRRCTPAVSSRLPDLGLDGCREALRSFVEFAAEQQREAHIDFYPRQAEFTEPFTAILRAVPDLKRWGLLHTVRSVNRGDLPGAKIRLFRETGVDACCLTIDGPEPIQDALRRDGSFRDTLAAFREARAHGIAVLPVMIAVQYNAPYVADTVRLVLAEGCDRFTLKVGIRGDTGGDVTRGVAHADSRSLWNAQLSATEYRALLLTALEFADSVRAGQDQFWRNLVLEHPLYARLFCELGRQAEYEELVRQKPREDVVEFALRPDGQVLYQQNTPALGAFPGGSFRKMFNAAHPRRLFPDGDGRAAYAARKQREFAKCRACPVTPHCPPTLVAAERYRLFYSPPVHCWVDELEATGHA